jgi:hypothetical protein
MCQNSESQQSFFSFCYVPPVGSRQLLGSSVERRLQDLGDQIRSVAAFGTIFLGGHFNAKVRRQTGSETQRSTALPLRCCAARRAYVLPMIMVGGCLLFVTTMTWHCALFAPWVTKMHCPHGSLAGELLVGLIIFLSPVVLFLKFYGVAFQKDGFNATTRTTSHCFCPYRFRPQRSTINPSHYMAAACDRIGGVYHVMRSKYCSLFFGANVRLQLSFFDAIVTSTALYAGELWGCHPRTRAERKRTAPKHCRYLRNFLRLSPSTCTSSLLHGLDQLSLHGH